MLDSLHLHLKTDRRPDGTKVAAVEKIEYINREGKYKDIDDKRMQDHDIFQCAIFASKAPKHHIERDQLLYDSPYGKIKETADGKIMVTKNASVETTAIALTVAAYIYGNEKLSLIGDRRFRGKVAVAGGEIGLPLHFQDESVNKIYQTTLGEYQDERTKCNTHFLAGNQERNKRDQTETSIPLPYPKPDSGKALTTREQLRVPVLPQRNMEIRKTTRAALLLHDAQGIHMDARGTERSDTVRRNFPRNGAERELDKFDIKAGANNRPRWNLGIERKKNAEETAKRILIQLEKAQDRTFAYSHIQYINREAAFQKRGGCIGKGHFLPKWAEDDPKRFFEKADIYERANGERYKEIEFALPNELPFEAQREIVETFIQQILPNHYYAYAMHDKIGQMSDGAHNVHVHIMFTTRENDGYENTIGRDAKTFFSRANSKNPEKGGCPKAKRWNDKDRNKSLKNEIRPVAAGIINKMLEHYGFDFRISEKNFQDRKAQAEKDGDKIQAKILNHIPEQHLDLKIVLRDDEVVDEVKRRRQYKKALAKDTYAAELMQILDGEKVLQNKMIQFGAQLDWLLKRKDTDKKELNALKSQLEKKSKGMLWAKNSYLAAAKKFMSPNEKKQFEDFLSLCQIKTGLEKMLADSNEDTKNRISKQLAETKDQLQRKAPGIEKIFSRLNRQRLEVLREQRAMIQNNKETKVQLVAALKNIEKAWKADKEARKKRAEAKTRTYRISDIRELLREQYRSAKENYEVQKTLAENLKKEVIPYERALLMAEGKFTGGDYKKLRTNLRKLKKSEDYLWHDTNQYEATLELWQKHGEGNPYKKADIDAQKKRIDERFVTNHEMRKALDKEQARLEALCSTPAAKATIQKIALAIMAQNQPKAQEYEKAMEKLNVLQDRVAITEDRLATTKERLVTYGDNAIYKTTAKRTGMSPIVAAHKDAQLIADGMLGKESAIPRVMQNMTNEDDDWSMLTESAKAERLADLRFREDW